LKEKRRLLRLLLERKISITARLSSSAKAKHGYGMAQNVSLSTGAIKLDKMSAMLCTLAKHMKFHDETFFLALSCKKTHAKLPRFTSKSYKFIATFVAKLSKRTAVIP
jgi:hypothetical protein